MKPEDKNPDVEKRDVKKFIKDKFGGLAKFCRISGYDRYEMQKLFQMQEPHMRKLRELMAIARRTKPGHDPKELSSEDLAKMKEAIDKAGGVSKFVELNPQFKRRTVFKILAGGIKRISPVMQDILYTLKVWKP